MEGDLMLPTDSAERKTYPLYRGLFKYFPRALAAIAHHSWANNEKHNPGEPVHWSREKSSDHEDCLLRHVLEEDWEAVAWRALAKLELELEAKATNTECHVFHSPALKPEMQEMVAAYKERLADDGSIMIVCEESYGDGEKDE